MSTWRRSLAGKSSPVCLLNLLPIAVVKTGPKGVGKSTLAKVACSEEKVREGERGPSSVTGSMLYAMCTGVLDMKRPGVAEVRSDFKPVSLLRIRRQGVVLIKLESGRSTAEVAEDEFVNAFAGAIGFSLTPLALPAAKGVRRHQTQLTARGFSKKPSSA